MMSNVPPAFLFIGGALLIPFLKGRVQSIYLVLLPVLGLINLLNIPAESLGSMEFLGMEIVLVRIDGLSSLFGYIFHIAAFLIALYGIYKHDNFESCATFFYVGSALGVVFAGDLLSLFCFWEMMTLGSACIILARRTKAAYAAALRFALFHIVGGLFPLAGIIVQAQATGSIEFAKIGLNGLGSYLIFIGFGINCAWPFVHTWLTDSYPEASIVGTVVLSVFTTKTAVYVLARGYPGTECLIWIGTAMAVFPIFYAVIENDLRRVLSYSLINQVGFMVVGIGIGTELALNGAVAHAFTDVLFKGLLFMSMGAVLLRTGKINGTDLGGLYKSMPITAIFCIVGAASISAFPFFSGFVSKSMIVDAVAHGNLSIIWLLLIFASAGVFHHAGIKIPYFAFFAHDSGIRTKEAPVNMLVAMGIGAFLCILVGTFPHLTLYRILPYPVNFDPYTVTHVLGQTQLLFFSALAFCLLMMYRIYPPELKKINLDVDWFYRMGGRLFVRFSKNPVEPLDTALGRLHLDFFSKPILRMSHFIWRVFDVRVVDGIVNRTADFVLGCADRLRNSQTGHVRDYAMGMVVGFLFILYFILH